MPQFTRILFPVDFSERLQATAPYVLSFARRYGSAVTLFHAIEPLPPLYAGMHTIYPANVNHDEIMADVRGRLREFAECELPKTDVTCETVVDEPAHAIATFAASHGVSLIAIPTHGYGVFRRTLLGSVTAKVLHDCAVPVWTSAHTPEPSHRAHPQPRRILCAVDLKEESRKILDFAIGLATDARATIEFLHIAPEGVVDAGAAELRMQELAADTARERQIDIEQNAAVEVQTMLAGGHIASVVRDVALRKRIDLVVIGRGFIHSHGSERFKANSYGIIRESPCPVISV